MSSQEKRNPFIPRGDKSQNLPGTLTFVGLRALDPVLQHGILAGAVGTRLITSLGGSVLSQGPTSDTGIAILGSLDLSPYRLALLGMTIGNCAKHVLWKLFIGEENMTISAAASISAFNTLLNSLNTLLFVNKATSLALEHGESPGRPGWPGAPLTVGSVLFVSGILTEFVCEIQRKAFKSNPENKGKPYTGGFFALARHINYGAYVLWRAGFALASAGWVWGSLVGTFFIYNFTTTGIPELDYYCERRYGNMWKDYKRKTPYKLFPYVY